MSRTKQHFLEKHWAILGVLVLGAAVTVAVAWAGHERSVRVAAEIVDRRALFVAEAVDSSVGATVEDAVASAALFVASEEVTETDFSRFVDDIDQYPGALGLAYVPRVSASDFASFLDDARRSDPRFSLFRLAQGGSRVVTDSDPTAYPVRYFVSGSGPDIDLRGFDAASDPAWVEVLERAAQRETVQVSRLTQLFGAPGQWGFLSAAPIIREDGVAGFTVSVARLESLVDGELADSLAEVVVWDVRDVTGGATTVVSPDPLRRAETLEVGGRVWRVDVIPTEGARRELTGYGLIAGLAVGLLLTVLAALAVHLAVTVLRTRRETHELQRLTEEKDEFLAAISHELRTPLTTVVGMAEILEESTVGADPEIREYVTLLRQEGRELARLVEDLLLIGRLDAQVLPLRPEEVELHWEVERIVAETEPPGRVELSIVGEGQAWADPLRLRHVIRHLYVNALRHGGDQVTIRIAEDPNQAQISVSDNGPGIPDDQLDRLFIASSGRKDTPGGPSSLGLGLRVSKRLAMVLGGDLTYRRADAVTVFELRLPRLSAAPIGEPVDVGAAGRRSLRPGS